MPIDTALPARHPYALELDEIVPISKGGSGIDPANVRAAHRCCNQWRGDKDVDLVQPVAAAARSLFDAWRSPAEFVLLARSAPKAGRSRGRPAPRVTTSREW